MALKQNVPTLCADLRKGVGVLVLDVWGFIGVPGIAHKAKLIALVNVDEALYPVIQKLVADVASCSNGAGGGLEL